MESLWKKFRGMPVWAQIVGWLVLAPFLAALFFWRSGIHFGKHVAVGFAFVGLASYAAMGAGGQAPVETPQAIAPQSEAPTTKQTLEQPPTEVAPEYTPTPEAPKPTAKPPSSKPKPKPVVVKPKPKKKPKPASSNCHPSYRGACLKQNAGDYDCAGGSGNGPNYVEGPVQVVGYDEFRLDADNDGVGCE